MHGKLYLLSALLYLLSGGLSSCRKPSCGEVDCQNGSQCMAGTCACPPAYKGASCGQLSALGLLTKAGSQTWRYERYQVSQNSAPLQDQPPADFEDWRITYRLDSTYSIASSLGNSQGRYSLGDTSKVFVFLPETGNPSTWTAESIAAERAIFRNSSQSGTNFTVTIVTLVPAP